MNSTTFKDFLGQLTDNFVPVVSSVFSKDDYLAIDLSESNKELDAIDVSSSSAFDDYIVDFLKQHNAQVAYGGYLEVRSMYRRSTHFNQQDPVTERNIHLGLDVWCDAGTEILAPIPGRIHSYKNNKNYGDYGPTIILEHNYPEITFYTLYGHLSVASLDHIAIGQEVRAGDVIARLGDASVNGDYAPHLHFQIMKDLEGNSGDYPGVSSKSELSRYQNNCPDPNLLLKIR
ncbi:peptidoglycan DD-metalloendopeptidase family protein [Aquimarina spongiae]|uniref:Peptidase family M23 n=1 Tax=Aquimarina spongiae TaxID=570521 RepID=A0A1M6K867_9FLAO|nr:peptidoglycan DD-metalloendopeptidase family protein [Aquimarina spongiae]SHJ55139.1 Peptidase family M23 [Aquimarina spongiae]